MTDADIGMLVLLSQHPRACVSSIDSGAWREIARVSRALGGAGFAIPLIAAREHNAYLLTAHPDRYPDVDRVIDIGHQ